MEGDMGSGELVRNGAGGNMGARPCRVPRAGVRSGASGKEPAYQCRRHGVDPWLGKIP